MKLLYFLCWLPLLSFSQQFSQKKVDSLLLVLNSKKPDTAKVTTYQLIFEEYAQYTTDLNKIKFYNNKIGQVSKKIKYQNGLGFYFFNHIFLFDENHLQNAIYYANKAAAIFYKQNNIKYFLESKCFVVDRFFLMGKLREAKKNISQTLPFALKNNNFYETGFLYMMLGRINYENRLHTAALKCYRKSLHYYNKDNSNPENKLLLYFNISFLYTDLEKYEQALYYLNIINKNYLDPSFNIEIARNYFKMNNFKKSLEFLIKNQKLKMTKYVADANTCMMGKAYFYLHKYNDAIYNLNVIISTPTNKIVKLESYNTLAKCYIKLHNFKKAIEYNEKASVLVNGTKHYDAIEDFFLCRIAIAEATKNYKEAFLAQKKYTALKDENFSKLNKDKISDLQIDFDVAVKDNSIKNLKVAQLQKTILLNRQNSYITYGSIFMVLLLLGILFFMKLSQTIEKKNILISISNTELENNKVQLEKSVQLKETLLKEVHHRVKNNLQLVMSLLYIHSKEKNTTVDDFLEISQSRIIAMALIHENLYQTGDLSKVDFKEYASNLTQSIIASYNNLQKDIKLVIEIESIYLDIQTAIPLGLIVNELISNAYKHAFINHKKGIIYLQVVQNGANFELVIKDNGVGMASKKATKKSLGLELVQQLVSQLHGSLQVQNVLGVWYQIQFQNRVL
jgi:two-component sensor histidine kinase